MKIVEIGDAPSIVAGLRMSGDVVDLLIADPYIAAVVQGFQVLRTGA
jgi:hypothetical protein